MGCFGMCCIHFVGKDEQLRVDGFTERVVYNGPCVKVLNPFSYRKAQKVKTDILGISEYAKVKDSVTGDIRIERGPQLLFLGPYDEKMDRTREAITLNETEYIIVNDQLTGKKNTTRGPCVWFPGSHDNETRKMSAITLEEDEYVCLKDNANGQRWVQKGPALLFLEPSWNANAGVKKAWTLQADEYVRLLNKVTGKITVHRGEQTVFPGPDDELLDNKIMRAVQVDGTQAVLVRDVRTGQKRLVTEKQTFVPGPNEVVEEVRGLISLSDHEAMIIKDKNGCLHYHFGNPEKQVADHPRSFFLQPSEEVLELWWSSGLRRKSRDLRISRFDCRAQYMWFEFDCRTSDNVELILECTFFWEVVDLAMMVRTTGNLPGDIYNQARSQFIKCVAHKTLKEFMDELHSISKLVFDEGTSFYSSRGVKIHSLEVTKYQAAEARTSEVLQQIIEESTNRLNRLSQAESENEVNMFKIQGQIEHEKLNGQLLEIQHEHAQSEARVAGAAEAECVKAFITSLQDGVPKLTMEDCVAMWQTLRKKDALSVVSAGGASLYYTPNDVDLSIKTQPSKAK